jgi:hypothetical protein
VPVVSFMMLVPPSRWPDGHSNRMFAPRSNPVNDNPAG